MLVHHQRHLLLKDTYIGGSDRQVTVLPCRRE
jgi:hypothetical protein